MEMYFVCKKHLQVSYTCTRIRRFVELSILLLSRQQVYKYRITIPTNNVYKLEQFETRHNANSLPFVINHIIIRYLNG